MKGQIINQVAAGERGHAETLIEPVVSAVGAVLLAIGAAGGTGWLAVVGGIVLAVGLVAMPVINHGTIEKGMYGRLDELEKK
jgi:hypothetical protein